MSKHNTESPNDLVERPIALGRYVTVTQRSVQSAAAFFGLSPREVEALSIMETGAPLKDIASRMHVTERTVETFKRRIFAKLGVNSSVTAVALLATFCAGGDLRTGAEPEETDTETDPAPQEAA